ncbi:helix-turn-helix domain-containing protein [Nocardia sp. BMG51109]|uniref:helix-turn-helix domain-containing protein n=1 Tax=Nocardia sp. BMG51109 TaxID=1056816 RepID=UPI000466EAD6|nr:helix-turn-helix domain-containing protein [Nocardia sp. BMG51109]
MAGTHYQPMQVSTLEVSKSDRTDFWVGHVCGNQGAVGCAFRATREFRGATRVQRLEDFRLGDFQLVDFASTGIRYERTARDVRADDIRTARLVIPIEGPMGLSQAGDAVRLDPGDMGVITWTRPMALEHDDYGRGWILTIPADDLPQLRGDRPPLTLDPRRALPATVQAMIRELAAHRETLSAWEFAQISSRIVELLGASLDDERAAAADRLAAIARDARTYIEKYSDDPTVTAASVAEHLGCSRRGLELALRSAQSSPAQLLRTVRLRRARQRLRDRFNTDTISTIAFDSGFGSMSAFKEAFLREYGVTPGQLRRDGRHER